MTMFDMTFFHDDPLRLRETAKKWHSLLALSARQMVTKWSKLERQGRLKKELHELRIAAGYLSERDVQPKKVRRGALSLLNNFTVWLEGLPDDHPAFIIMAIDPIPPESIEKTEVWQVPSLAFMFKSPLIRLKEPGLGEHLPEGFGLSSFLAYLFTEYVYGFKEGSEGFRVTEPSRVR